MAGSSDIAVWSEERLAPIVGAAWRAHPSDPQLAARETARTLRPLFEQARAEIDRGLQGSASVMRALRQRSALLDTLLRALFSASATENALPIVLLATGGYGREEMFPHSDLDLLFLHDGKSDKAASVPEFILYLLWDLGLKVGHAVRDVKATLQAAKDDTTILTALLDARVIHGDPQLADKLFKRLRKNMRAGGSTDFVEAKMLERERRHVRHGDTRYALEPNVKDGKGGLRDLHSLAWIVHYHYPVQDLDDWLAQGVLSEAERNAYQKSRDFLWEVRTHLHMIAGRAEERLGFDFQKPVAAAMGFDAEKGSRSLEAFMKRYFQTTRMVGTLTRIVCAVLEEENKRKPRLSLGATLKKQEKLGQWLLENGRLMPLDGRAFAHDPVQWFELFADAHKEKIDIHPKALRLIAHNLHRIDRDVQKDQRANALFLAMLASPQSPEAALRQLHEAGILARFIPDFGRVTGLMQYDRYHTLTVDEHTLHAIGMLHAIERGEFIAESPVSTEIIRRLESKRVLYLALFCHDIAKGRGGDHSELGKKIARRLAQRLGFTLKEQEDTAWLVAAHLIFSHTAFKRDLNDEKTIQDFIALVQSPERLRLLLILTVADIRAVGPTIWNGWKGALLRELYAKAEAGMGAAPTPAGPDKHMTLLVTLTALLPKENAQTISDYIDLGYPAFWNGCEHAEHARLFKLLKKAESKNLSFAIDQHIDNSQSVTRLLLVTPDQPRLFSKVTGAMALSGANIVTAKIFTLKNGMAVEIFGVQDSLGKPFNRKSDKRKKLEKMLEKALSDSLDFSAELAKLAPAFARRADAIKVPPAVYIDNDASNTHSVIEVNGRDRVGFLHRVSHALAELGLNITTAIVATYGDRAVDVFYVKDIFGHKVHHEGKLAHIRERLLAAAKPNERKSC